MDKVYTLDNLRSAFAKVKANKGSAGVDHQTADNFEQHLEKNLERLHEALKSGTYVPQAIKRVMIPKPGKAKEKRPLGVPTVRDRVVQTALRNVIEPIYERDFSEHSYGFRPGRGCKDALRRVDALLKSGRNWVVDADIKSYFDSIPHEALLERLREKVTDGKALSLIESFLNQKVMETAKSWQPEGGTPQGAVISPLLSNIYLDPLDKLMERKGFEMVRYADDFVVLCENEAEARQALDAVRRWCRKAGLSLHPEKTRVVDASRRGGFDFLGYHFERGWRWPSDKSMKKFKHEVRKKTKRTNGHSLEFIIEDLNRTLRGWFEYFKHSHKNTFSAVDRWIRGRLRSILRKRRGGKGRGRGRDHQRWPNSYFAERGLFSLTAARVLAGQSSRR
jgi:RNA-directed DNA polymerase